jgi:excisionase family DNA binding protein
MSIDEVAATLRISERGVYRLISSGQLVSLKVGHRTLVEPAEVRSFIASQRQSCDHPRPERAA